MGVRNWIEAFELRLKHEKFQGKKDCKNVSTAEAKYFILFPPFSTP